MTKKLIFAVLLGSFSLAVAMGQDVEKNWLKKKHAALPVFIDPKAEKVFFSDISNEEKIAILKSFENRTAFANFIPALAQSAIVTPEEALVETLKEAIAGNCSKHNTDTIINFCYELIKKNKERYMPFLKDYKIITLWIKRGTESVPLASTTFFHHAVQKDNLPLLKLLVVLIPNVDVNVSDYSNKNLLHYACSEDMIEYLLDNGVSWQQKNRFGFTALQSIGLRYNLKLLSSALNKIIITEQELKELKSFFVDIVSNTLKAQSEDAIKNHAIANKIVALIDSHLQK